LSLLHSLNVLGIVLSFSEAVSLIINGFLGVHWSYIRPLNITINININISDSISVSPLK